MTRDEKPHLHRAGTFKLIGPGGEFEFVGFTDVPSHAPARKPEPYLSLGEMRGLARVLGEQRGLANSEVGDAVFVEPWVGANFIFRPVRCWVECVGAADFGVNMTLYRAVADFLKWEEVMPQEVDPERSPVKANGCYQVIATTGKLPQSLWDRTTATTGALSDLAALPEEFADCKPEEVVVIEEFKYDGTSVAEDRALAVCNAFINSAQELSKFGLQMNVGYFVVPPKGLRLHLLGEPEEVTVK